MKEEIKFEIGDVVRLKSGGPWMTVSSPKKDGCIECEWFSGYPESVNGIIQSHFSTLI